MPLIEVHLIEKVFNPEQKRQIIQKLTDAMVSIEGENMRGVTWVKIAEVTSGDWGIGGQPLTTEAVKQLAAQSPPAFRIASVTATVLMLTVTIFASNSIMFSL